jgi:DNA-binding response OmpR family regulator
MLRILCVEDAADVVAILEVTLIDYQVAFASSVTQALELLKREQFHLALFDIELPDGSGLEILASLQTQRRNMSVIFLTSKKDFASKVTAFSLGADDFIVKPFDPKELRLRVDAKLRKLTAAAEENSVLRIGTLTCNLQEQRIFKNSGRDAIDLTSFEFRIFHLLAKTPNKIFSREEILDRVWGNGVSVTDRAVDVHISNVRKKLAGTDVSIEAVIGSGYRILIADKKLAQQA